MRVWGSKLWGLQRASERAILRDKKGMPKCAGTKTNNPTIDINSQF